MSEVQIISYYCKSQDVFECNILINDWDSWTARIFIRLADDTSEFSGCSSVCG